MCELTGEGTWRELDDLEIGSADGFPQILRTAKLKRVNGKKLNVIGAASSRRGSAFGRNALAMTFRDCSSVQTFYHRTISTAFLLLSIAGTNCIAVGMRTVKLLQIEVVEKGTYENALWQTIDARQADQREGPYRSLRCHPA